MRTDASTMPESKAQQKRLLFTKVFKDEFLKELQYLWDVANDRAVARDTMIEKIVNPIAKATSIIPWLGEGIKNLIGVAEFAASLVRDKRIEMIAPLEQELDIHKLSILLDIVSREALRRYESFIVDRLSDDMALGVIPFAKVGAQRIIQRLMYQSQSTKQGKQLVINESALLAGLVEGCSGAWISGFTNNLLILKKTAKNWRGVEQPITIEAEDVYGRSAFRHFIIQEGKLIDQLYVRKQAKHSELPEWKKISYEKIQEYFGNFGYVRFKTKPHDQDPMSGYVLMPVELIKNRYDFSLQEMSVLSPELQAELKSSSHSILQIDKKTLEKYLTWFKTHKKSLVEYVRETLHYPLVETVVCREDLSGLTLAGVNLSHTDLSGAILSGDLSCTDLGESYLVGAEFRSVTAAKNLSLRGAHCQHLIAKEIDFTNSDFTQTNFSYAQLNGSQLTGCKLLGAVWVGADLRETKSDADLLKEQKQQLENLNKQILDDRQRLHNLDQEVKKNTQKIDELEKKFLDQIRKEKKGNIDLETQICQLMQYHQNRIFFEMNCEEQIRHLQKNLASADTADEVKKLQTELNDIKSQLSDFNQLTLFNTIINEKIHAVEKVIEKIQSEIKEKKEATKKLAMISEDEDPEFTQQLTLKIQNLEELQKHWQSLQQGLIDQSKRQEEVYKNQTETLRKDLEKLLKECHKRIENLEKEVSKLNQWAITAKSQIKALQSAQADGKESQRKSDDKLRQLELKVTEWASQDNNHVLIKSKLENMIKNMQSITDEKDQKELIKIKDDLDGIKTQIQKFPFEKLEQQFLEIKKECVEQKFAIKKLLDSEDDDDLSGQLQKKINKIDEKIAKLSDFEKGIYEQRAEYEKNFKNLQDKFDELNESLSVRLKKLEDSVIIIGDKVTDCVSGFETKSGMR